MKKNLHPRTEESNENITEISRKKKAKKNNPETDADSFSADYSSFVALVKASNLEKDTLELPKDVISSKGLKRICRKIVLTDERKRSWTLGLRFNTSSDTFSVSRGWTNFCHENGKKEGDFFIFKSVEDRETPLLIICRATSSAQKSNKESLRCKDSTSQSLNRFMSLRLTHSGVIKCSQYLSLPFMRENGLDKPGMITLVGKDGTEWLVNRRKEASGNMRLGQGWKDFAKANGLKIGESFTLELIWENGAPRLRLYDTGSTSSRRQQGEHCSNGREKEHVSAEPNSGKKVCRGEVEKNHLRCRDTTSPSLNRFLTLRVAQDSFRKCRQYLQLSFMRENGLDKPGLITLIGKDGTKWMANLCQDSSGIMYLGKGWRDFAKANGLKIGESFTLESIWKGATPMLSLFRTESTCDPRQQGHVISTEPTSGNKIKKGKTNREEKSSRKLVRNKCQPNTKDTFSPIQNSVVTLTLEPEDVKACKLDLPSQFMRANGIDKLGKITLLGKDGMTYSAFRLSTDGFMAVGIDWKNFCETNGVHTGESFTLELMYEQDAVPVLKFRPNRED